MHRALGFIGKEYERLWFGNFMIFETKIDGFWVGFEQISSRRFYENHTETNKNTKNQFTYNKLVFKRVLYRIKQRIWNIRLLSYKK